jgi:hypothetical protein
MGIKEDLVPQRLLKRMKAAENGRLEVTWRIYNALCGISTGDLTETQTTLLQLEKTAAYERWIVECDLMNEDGLQGKRGFAAAKRQHLRELETKAKSK